ncbi:MAG: hypothetical protein FWF53_07155 [Candidatus Azobacteroides sp.]|nr:hypothetical protein [Candidatus Azobacteroides sp.]
MKEIIKEIIKETGLRSLTGKQKAICAYFIVSFCILGSLVTEETTMRISILIVLNFANAVRLLKKVPVPKCE